MEHLKAWFNEVRGRKQELAKVLGVTHGALSQWKKVPLERVIDVSDATGIPPHKLRPDQPRMFPPPIFRPQGEAQNG